MNMNTARLLPSTSDTTTPVPVAARRRPFSFAVPADQAAALAASVPLEEMQRVRTLLCALAEIHSAPKILPACRRLASGLNRRGWSPFRLRQVYYRYISGTAEYPAGDWRILLDKTKARLDRPLSQTNLPAGRRVAFIEFWRKIGEDFHQDWAAAHDELLRIWRTGHNHLGRQFTQIPGYESWPDADPHLGHPAGWSYANLMRHQSDLYDQVAARIGHAKASAHRVPVLTTRVGLPFGAFFEFDDHEFNQRVLFQRRPMRPLGFGCVEVLSACVCHTGLKPTLWDFEEEVRRKLTEREFMWFVVALLTHLGYRPDIGTTLIVERGTAAIRAEFAARLERVSGGKLQTFVGGRFGRAAHAGQFDGRSKGNFRTKKLIEGSWALIDNATAMLPAQTGRGRDDAPEGFAPGAGAEQYTNRLLKAAEASNLSPEQFAQLQFPYPPFHTWREWALDAIHRVNSSSRHDLEGWEKLGFLQSTWRLPSSQNWLPWQNFLALPAPEQSVVRAMLDQDPSLLNTQRLSRQDVFNAHRHLLQPLPWELLPELVGPENALNGGAEPLEVRSGLFRFECADIDPDPIEFYARDYRDSAGHFLPNGEKFVAYVNPYCPTHLVACDAAGKVMAVCPRYTRALRTDTAAVHQLLGAQSAFESAARVRLNLRHQDQAAARQQMLDNNLAILGGASRPARKDPRLANYAGDVADLAEPDPARPDAPAPAPAPDTDAFVDPAAPSTSEPASDDSDTSALL